MRMKFYINQEIKVLLQQFFLANSAELMHFMLFYILEVQPSEINRLTGNFA